MTPNKIFLLVFSLLASSFWGVANATVISYEFVRIDSSGGNEAWVLGINNSGNVVGYSAEAWPQGFYRDSQGDISSIAYPGASGTAPFSINDYGQIVGAIFYSGGGAGSFTRTADGSYLPIIVPPGIGAEAYAYGVNNNGKIVGTYNQGTASGFLWEAGLGFSLFNYPGALHTQALGVNDSGFIVGTWSLNDVASAFIRDPSGSFTSVSIAGSIQTLLFDINEIGQSVGFYIDQNYLQHGFFRDSDGSINTIEYPGSSITLLYGINDKGQLSGTFASAQDGVRGFIATPISEPETLALLGLGLAGLAAIRLKTQ